MASEDGSVFVRSGVLRSPFVITRTQAAGDQSSAIAADGSSLTFYGADTPRFNGSAQRLLIEGPRTNTLSNPRCAGAVAGTPGSLPTIFMGFGSGNGLTREVVGSGSENGTPYVDIRFFGTTTNSSFTRLAFTNSLTQLPTVVLGDNVTSSVYVRLVGGSTVGVDTFRTQTFGITSGGAFVPAGGITTQNFFPTSAPLSSQRIIGIYPVTDATVGYGYFGLDFTWTIGATIDFTLRVGSPQLKLGAFADTDIFPPVGTPGASTRGVDLISATLANLGVTSGITMLWSGLIYQAPAIAGEQTILHVSDGTSNNRYRLISENGSGNILLLRATAGVGGPNIITPGSPRPTNSIFKLGLSIDISTGTAISSLNGGAVGTITGGPTSGLTSFNLGSANSAVPMFGETARLRILPYSVPDATLQSLVSTL